MRAEAFSAEAVARIETALRKALNHELAQQQVSDTAGVALAGPWAMLVNEGYTWSAGAQLNPALYAELRGHFGANIVREILLAAAGIKVSRTCLSDANLDRLRAIAGRYGFVLIASAERYIHGPDKGKGGASNTIERKAMPQEEGGLRNVYVASDASLAEAARLLEEAGDDEIFGLLLGIPACCRKAFKRLQPIAEAKQNDFVPFVLDRTPGPMPYDSWLNYPAHYFGGCLLSFFPCSFRCPAARQVAVSTFEMLAECDRAWAKSFLDLHRTNILYTEYDGLHLFRRRFADGSIDYGPDDFSSTELTPLHDLIQRGNRLEVRGKQHVVIYRGLAPIGTVEGQDVAMGVFW